MIFTDVEVYIYMYILD